MKRNLINKIIYIESFTQQMYKIKIDISTIIWLINYKY